MAVTERDIRSKTDHELLLLKQVSGNATIERIDAELNRRIRAARKAQRDVAAGAADPLVVPPGLEILQPVRRGAVILAELPPSHNEIWVPVIRDGKPTLVLSATAREWKKWATNEVLLQWVGKPFFKGPIDVTVVCVLKDGDRRDTPNLEKLLWDTLEGICYANDGLIRDRKWMTRFDRFREGLLVEIADHRSIAMMEEEGAHDLAAG